jgi:hypothetical protein
MTTPNIITYEVLTGYSHETGQEFHLVVFRGEYGRLKRCQLRLRNTPAEGWSEPLEMKHLPWEEGGPMHPSVA